MGDQLPRLQLHVRDGAAKTVLSPTLPSKRDALSVEMASNDGLDSYVRAAPPLALLSRKAVSAMVNIALRTNKPPPEEDAVELALHSLKVELTRERCPSCIEIPPPIARE